MSVSVMPSSPSGSSEVSIFDLIKFQSDAQQNGEIKQKIAPENEGDEPRVDPDHFSSDEIQYMRMCIAARMENESDGGNNNLSDRALSIANGEGIDDAEVVRKFATEVLRIKVRSQVAIYGK